MGSNAPLYCHFVTQVKLWSCNVMQMCNLMFLQLCVKWPLFPILSPSSGQQTTSFDQQQRHSLLTGRLETVLILEEKKPKSVEMDTQLILETKSMMNTIVISNSKINNISGNVVSLYAAGAKRRKQGNLCE